MGIQFYCTIGNKAGKEGLRYVDALRLLDRTEEELREAEAERKTGDVVELVETPAG